MKQLRESVHSRRPVAKYQTFNIHDSTQFGPLPNAGPPVGNNSWQKTNPSASYARPPPQDQYNRYQQTNNRQFEQSDDLFSPSECSEIMEEFMSKLSTCRSKYDQIRIIGEITFKFLYNHNGYTK